MNAAAIRIRFIDLTRLAASLTGGGRNNTAFATLKTVVVAPMPSDNESTATSVNLFA